MAVTLWHDGERITSVEADMDRAPWTTCPGAPLVLQATFGGISLADAGRPGSKQANCTHLYDLATLAAAHWDDRVPLVYDIFVSDPVEGCWHASIAREGQVVLELRHRDDILIEPEGLAGVSLFKLRDWIEGLAEPLREPGRLLQWGTILAHGRVIPMERQSDASRMPANCFTFQPERKAEARRVGRVIDFSRGTVRPLDHLGVAGFSTRAD